VGLALLHEPLVRVIYQRGAFTEESVRITGQAVFFYAMGLSVYSVSYVLTYAFYSVQDTRTPMVVGLVRMAFKILLSFLLVGLMAHAGLALAESLSFVVKAVLLLLFLPKKLRGVDQLEALMSFGSTVLITGGMGALIFLALPYLQRLFEVGTSVAATSMGLAAAIALGVASYMLFSLLFQRSEMKDVYKLVRAGLVKP
jgi:putative peptidoglycan lipid II flippase